MKKQLTKAEEQIMHILWEQEKAYLKDVVGAFPEPKPHSNTVATILKILIDKGFATSTTMGRNNLYRALVSKESYGKNSMNSIVDKFFEGSFTETVSFMVKKKQLSIKELELLLKELKQNNS